MSSPAEENTGMELVLNMNTVPTVQDARQIVEQAPEEDRYTLQLKLGIYMLEKRDENEEAISIWYDYVIQSGVWKRERTEADFRDEWERARSIRDRHQRNLAYIEAMYQKAVSKCGVEHTQDLFVLIRTKTIAESVSKLLTLDASFEELRRGINHELVRRLANTGRGYRRAKYLIQGDLKRAAGSLCTEELRPSQFKTLGLALGPHGWLVERHRPPSPDIESVDQDCGNEQRDHGENARDHSENAQNERAVDKSPTPSTPPSIPLTPLSTGARKAKSQRRRKKGNAPDPFCAEDCADEVYQQQEDEFNETGNVILPKLFGWLDGDISTVEGIDVLSRMIGRPITSLMQLIHIEFDIYDYHYSPAIAKPRLGWSRNMFQSLTQQLGRQDVCYYAAYVAVRPDYAWKLISFPYYTKSAYLGENTAFTYIDLNIGDYLATGRGGSAVQGSLSFTDKDKENCTIILPKIHLRLEE
ncbi:uncharacterized protein N7479_001653 [Penicillium vulpinum]|uniref:uncharacterized protein n=1 Tax=Penicillium vulpinum TaxID=29845 RepID=UPI0025496ED1|nr:uncharacterized protein N7479_001653 [Penicillium vulpinum]KAJ5971735.1 hypothetical protein N7479_001653 [Penicillium vulpinum]